MKKIITILTIIVLFISNAAYASNEILVEEVELISIDCAYTVALNFIFSNQGEIKTDIDGDLYAHGIECVESGYPDKVIISEIVELTDEEKITTAYLVKITDTEYNPNGYVIINANKSEYPIIEYSYESEPFLDLAAEKIICNEYKNTNLNKSDMELLYTGDYNYYISFDDDIYSLQDGRYEKTNKAAIKKVNKKEEYEENSVSINSEWKALTSDFSGGSNPPTGTVITSPISYESGYDERAVDYCYNMGTTYFEMDDFGTGAICTPTAGTNLCLYWTRRVSSYCVLIKNSSWQDTFDRLFELMETDYFDGTYWPEPARSAMKTYFREMGLSSTSAYYSECTSTTDFNDYIKAEINNGRPILLALWGDEMYNDHTVLGLGYERYKYDGVWTSHYIRINDGWSTGVDRYVHYETGRSSITRIRVTPGW